MASVTSEESGGSDGVIMKLVRKTGVINADRFLSIAWTLITKPHVVDSRLTGGDILRCWLHPSGHGVKVSATVPELNHNQELRVRRKLIPRNPQKFCPVIDNCILEERKLSIISEVPHGLGPDLQPVVACPLQLELRLDDDDKLSLWTSAELCPRLAEHIVSNAERWASAGVQDSKQMQVMSLGLISVERYSQVYAELKQKYGRKLVEIWTEKTDPLKFVYEDIAIASYLIALWDPENTGKKVSFVDVGCGNGLLVYILNLEGHEGLGVDVRERKIWALYPDEVRSSLREEAVGPETRYSAEWWIGNHSDELTMWIPLLATMSSASAKVMLLPCCPYGLYGKFQRTNHDRSQYQSYLNHLHEEFLPECGFKVQVDKMRIPSTKRVCFVASERLADSYEDVVARLQKRLEREKSIFVPRAKEIQVRNCTQLDRSLTDPIVLRVATHLLNLNGGTEVDGFNSGGQEKLGEIVKLLDDGERSVLKSQCGGLQTLLKNNYHVFKVCSGLVSLRLPEETQESFGRDPKRIKRLCWFYSNHPQGCPQPSERCRFAHEPPA